MQAKSDTEPRTTVAERAAEISIVLYFQGPT
jgi:hypothetical protein